MSGDEEEYSGDDAQVSDHEDNKEESKEIEDIRNINVVTKYKTAAEIANAALKAVIDAAKPGAKIVDLCTLGDQHIVDATTKVYKGKKILKGIGFPTCISVNETVGCFSPLAQDEAKLENGDLVKIDLGVQIDGYVATVAHTIVCGSDPITGKKADVLAAAYTATQCALRMMKPGTKNTDITKILENVATDFGCTAVNGVLSHQIKRFELHGEKVIANYIPDVPQTGDNKIKNCELEAHEVWALDVVMSTGKGKPQEIDSRFTTVYSRNIESNFQLKMKASRGLFSEVVQKYPYFPFTLRALEFDEKKRQFGASNAAKHDLLHAYPVLFEKKGEFVAHFKFTVLLLPDNTVQVTGLPYDIPANVQPDKSVTSEAVKAILATALSTKKKNKKKNQNKKKKKKAGAGGAAGAGAGGATASSSSSAAAGGGGDDDDGDDGDEDD